MIEALAREAAGHWPQITGDPVLVMHRENSVFRVATTAGPHALRLHRPDYHPDAALRSELEWMAMLSDRGMQVPAPLAARAGGFLVTLTNGRRASLLSWLPGQPMGATRAPLPQKGAARAGLFHAIGQQMARLHDLTDAWTPPPDFQRPRWDVEGLVGEAPFWGPFWTIDASPADRSLLAETRSFCRAALSASGAGFGLIHADLVRENVLVDDGDVRFIDFDDCGFGFRVFELVTAILKNHDEPDAAELEAALIAGYRPLSEADRAALPVLLVLRALTYLGWAESRLAEPGMAARKERYLRIARSIIRTRL